MLDQGRRVYCRVDGYLIRKSLEEFCNALFNAGLLGWWVTGIFNVSGTHGDYVYSIVDNDRSANFSVRDDAETSDARIICSHRRLSRGGLGGPYGQTKLVAHTSYHCGAYVGGGY